jgi:uncharacterized protein
MEPQHVALFLKQHPRFFEQHPELLEQLQLADSHSHSLVERQALLLQQKKNELEKQLQEFVQHGETNDRISQQLHRLTLECIQIDRLDTLLDIIPTLIQEHFAAAQVVIRIWGNDSLQLHGRFPQATLLGSAPASWLQLFPLDTARSKHSSHPVCLHDLPTDIRSWFSPDLLSFALLPLEHPTGVWGTLGLASYDARRFQPTHGTLYLQRLADIISAVLCRHMC